MAAAAVLHALADPTRRRIFERLRGGPRSVAEIASGLAVSRPAVSQHLRILRGAHLLRERRDGRRRLYAVDLRGLAELRTYVDNFWDDVQSAFADAAATHRAVRRGSS